MTGASHPDLDQIVADWNTNRLDRALAAMQGNTALVAQIRAEIARLEETSGPRKLLVHDEGSRQLHRVLKALLAASDISETARKDV